MRALAISELGYEVVIEGDNLVVLKEGKPYTLSPQEEAKVVERSEELQYAAYKKQVQTLVEAHINRVAEDHGYDSMMSVRSWTAFPNEFQRECINLAMWAGDVWKTVTDLEKKVQAGEIPLPSVEELPALLPECKE